MSLTTAGWIWAGPTADPLRADRSPALSIWTIARNRIRSWDSGILVDLLDLVAGDSPFKADSSFKELFHLMPAPGKLLPGAQVRTGHYVGLRRGNTLGVRWGMLPSSRNRRKWPFLAFLRVLTIKGYHDTPSTPGTR